MGSADSPSGAGFGARPLEAAAGEASARPRSRLAAAAIRPPSRHWARPKNHLSEMLAAEMTFASAEPWAADSACSSCAVRVVAYPARAAAAATTRRRRRRCCQVWPARPGSVWQSALTVAMGPTCQRSEMRPCSLRARSFLFCSWPRARREQLPRSTPRFFRSPQTDST